MLPRNTSPLMKRLILLLCAVLLFAALYFIFSIARKEPEEHTHFHAGFLVYINGERQDYSATRFMHLDVCSIPGKQDTHTLDEKDTVHLHDNVGDIAHIHTPNVTWGMLFANMNVAFPKNTPIIGYRNGKIVQNILSTPIYKDDSVIIVVGDEKKVDVSTYVTIKRIREVEGKSNTCEP